MVPPNTMFGSRRTNHEEKQNSPSIIKSSYNHKIKENIENERVEEEYVDCLFFTEKLPHEVVESE
jgi:hypothetical protein